jgi:hypothetical protein
MKPYYNFFLIILQAFDDYKKENDIKEGTMNTMFFDFMLERYGIEILMEGSTGYQRAAYNIKDTGYIRAAYNIKNIAKHSLFALKYGHMLEDKK